MKKIDFVVLIVLVISIILIGLTYFGVGTSLSNDEDSSELSTTDQRNELHIPPLLMDQASDENQRYFELNVAESSFSILPGEKTTTFGYNE